MSIKCFLKVAIFAFTFQLQSVSAGERLNYTLTISTQQDKAVQVEIILSFSGEKDGQTVINLPNSWGGEEHLWTGISDLSITGNGARVELSEDPFQRVVRHQSGARLTLSYRVIQDWPGVPMATGRNSYRPVIQPEYVHLIGDTIFAIPENFNESTVSIKIKTPETWVFASDLEAEGLNVDALRSSVMVAGDFRIESRPVDNAVLRVALRGDWDFTDAHFADMVQRVVQANHTYWGDPGEDFLVTVLPLEAVPGSQSMGGTSRTDAFAFFATANLDENTAIQILTHEHAHTWNPRRLGGGYDEDEEAAGYWFSEGFTDFLTQRIGVSAGLWTATDSLSRWNEVLSEYALSPENTASNSKIRDGFWDNRDLNRLPYIRGMLFAAHAEYQIRSGSEGRINLNNVMKAMRRNNNEIDAAPGSFVDQTLATTGIDLKTDYEQFILKGEVLRLAETAFGPCGSVITSDQPVFDYGMTGHRNKEGKFVVDTVDMNSPAAPAGFKPGMVILKRLEGAVGDATVDSVLRVEFEDTVKDLRYLPTNGDMVTMQQIVPSEKITNDACNKFLSGRSASNGED